MAPTHQIFFFGDAHVDKLSALKTLFSHSKTHPQLRDFLRSACDVIQCQIWTLLPEERGVFGHFDDLLELGERYAREEFPDEMIGYVLITTIQVGDLLFQKLTENNNNTHLLGLCIGLLAASVAAAVSDTSEIAKLGTEIIAISLRLGVAVRRRSRCIEDTHRSWGCILFGLEFWDLEKKLEEFNKNFPKPRWAYAGVSTKSWTTVFGPPSTLQNLCTAIDVPHKLLTSANAAHASHLVQLDISSILGDSPILGSALPRTSSLVSISTGSPYPAASLRELLHAIVDDIAHKPMWIDKTVEGLASIVNIDRNSEITLTTLGPSSHTGMVQRILAPFFSAVHISAHVGSHEGSETANSGGRSSDIAVIGMSGRFPFAEDVKEFWEVLQAGQALHEMIPPSRFSISDFHDPTGETKNSLLTTHGVFLRHPGLFDNKLFNVSPKEALQMDPLQRLLLLCTYEALEKAGYARNSSTSTHPSKIGTYFGQTVDDWKDINAQMGIDTHYLPSLDRAFHPGRVAHYFKWGGGFYSVDTACSSSLTCAHLACEALNNRELDMAIVAGGSLLGAPEMFSGLGKGGFLSATGGCKTFHDDADGYCRGEALGVVVLKRLEDAVRENDNILAVIKGTERNSNAGAASITYPGQEAQETLFGRLLRKANVDPHDVGFVEMHGTGTQAGDNVETNSVRNVFAQNRGRDNPLHIGAVKAIIGHSEAAAGIASLIKSLLILREGSIPTQPEWPFKLNHKFPDLEASNIIIADGKRRLVPRPNGDGKRRIVVNSFDAAGGNTSLLIEDAPRRVSKSPDPRSHHVVTVSARTLTSHAANKKRLIQYLKMNPDTTIADLAYTTTARREHELYRVAFVCEYISELTKQLHSSTEPELPPKSGSSLIFVFTGQSAQYTGMGRILYETSPRFKQTLDTYQSLCDSQDLAFFIDIIRGTQDVKNATAAQLQLAIVALEIALAHYWESLGLKPRLVIGHSLGEYAALCIAGVLSISDTLFLVNKRATLMEKQCGPGTSTMLAIALPKDKVSEVLKTRSFCEISCLNGPSSTVVSGPTAEIKLLQIELKEKKVQSSLLPTEFGFHSQAMDPMLEDFEVASNRTHFMTPKMPVASTLTGDMITSEGVFNATYLRRQIREPVTFMKAVRACESEGFISNSDVILEIGPHPVCIGLITQSLSDAQPTCLPSLHHSKDNWKTISEAIAAAHVAKLPVLWHEFHADYSNSARILDLPTYAFDLKDYWVPYRAQLPAAPQTQAKHTLSTTCLQKVESLNINNAHVSAIFTSQVSEPHLYKAIRGHIVDDVAICPASVFCDMAYTASKFVLEQAGIKADLANLELVGLNMTHALVVHSKDTEQIVHVSADLNSTQKVISITFSSIENSSSMAEHGTCRIVVNEGNVVQEAEWSRMQRLVESRVSSLENSKTAHHMTKPLIYKLFSTLVDYDKSYQALSEISIEENFEDAAATMVLKQNPELGSFTHSPYIVDALVHLAGLLLNVDPAKSKTDLYIAGNIGRMSIMGDLSKNQQCTAYATIRERTSKGICLCDVYVFADTNLVAMSTDIKFQRLSRDIFGMMLGKEQSFDPYPAPRKTRFMHKDKGDAASSVSDSSENSWVPTLVSSTSSQTSVEALDLSSILLNTVAAKTGVSVLEMEDNSSFADLGIDSPMSISIIADFRKRTEVELPAAFFSNFPTVVEAKGELGSVSETISIPPPKPLVKQEQRQNLAAKRQRSSSQTQAQNDKKSKNTSETTQSTALFKIVAAELGIDITELTPGTEFAEIGVDSMLSIKILSIFKKKSGTELPAAFFNSNSTITSAREELDGSPSSQSYHTATSESQPKPPKSRVILIQGKSHSKATPLFLATDGSGAVTPYIHFPALPHGRKIYALESPFLETPDEYTLSIQEMADIFITAMRTIQPHGPYLIGGWSAGGIYAYEIAHRLAMVGETITGLVIIDTRINVSVPKADVTMEFIERFGIFTGVGRGNLLSGLSMQQKQHLTSTVRALCKYDAVPFPAGRAPRKTHIIWASKGLNDSANLGERNDQVTRKAAMRPGSGGKNMSEMELGDFEEEFKSWFFGKRRDFGTNGWEELLLKGDVKVHKVDADHFSMVVPPRVKELGSVLLESIEDFTRIEAEEQ
ncbi:putative polyketide synthase protein [Botrytis fragariae]|uniref:Putative polyketide synthase protein n=1 Tax=Botrytis fragariae TaxID=1964551 RepID=A0A8H6AQ40_9HELO|nr:putative polyketide synthase protein [Botrytis fragariae]KAF5871521.1 putative polyketide synthase protein [Botrytis fragariae]